MYSECVVMHLQMTESRMLRYNLKPSNTLLCIRRAQCIKPPSAQTLHEMRLWRGMPMAYLFGSHCMECRVDI